jgi:hypothetical protein
MALSAFGVDDCRISKASPDGTDLHVPAPLSRREKRRKVLSAAAIGAGTSAATGAALKLKPVEMLITTGVTAAGSAAQALNGSRTPKRQ